MQKNKLVVSADQTRSLSKTQTKFNSLVAKIEELKAKKIHKKRKSEFGYAYLNKKQRYVFC